MPLENGAGGRTEEEEAHIMPNADATISSEAEALGEDTIQIRTVAQCPPPRLQPPSDLRRNQLR
jgi:hypothetical protein